ncbi:Pfam:DUF2665 [Teratosphaeria destructans]|uniref:Pfam:DUF2665 n=1 Tax=Teratosphaeria destructans TaxID=418781 RepID=A0A9W7T0Y4_9PEZI|nr:Pfam:DUF2665 [Teratosphaeria destructans]
MDSHHSRSARNRSIDPFFAMGVGVMAAVVRINREEKEKGRSTAETIESLRRRVGMIRERVGGGGRGGA